MIVDQEKYQGFIIHHNLSDDRYDEFYSIMNPKTKTHCHTLTKKLAKRVIDCAVSSDYAKSNYQRFIRMKALRLLGYKI